MRKEFVLMQVGKILILEIEDDLSLVIHQFIAYAFLKIFFPSSTSCYKVDEI